MRFIKEYLKVIGYMVAMGIAVDVVIFLGMSFTFWEWLEIDWNIARGIIASSVALGILLFPLAHEDNEK